MIVVYIFWLVCLIFITSSSFNASIINPLFKFVEKIGIGTFALLIILIHSIFAYLIYRYYSLGFSIILMSHLGLFWSLLVYYLTQRFASTFEMTGTSRATPLFQPGVAFICFLSCILSLGYFLSIRFILLPIIVWFATGILATELQIKKNMKTLNEKPENISLRQYAIYVINYNQGREWRKSWLRRDKERYPFP